MSQFNGTGRQCWANLKGSGAGFWPIWANLRGLWAHFGLILRGLGHVLDPFWAHLSECGARFWPMLANLRELGPLWANLKGSGAHFKPIWGCLGPFLGQSKQLRANFSPFWGCVHGHARGDCHPMPFVGQDCITYPFFGLSAWFAPFQPSCQVSFQPFVGIIQPFICRVAYIQPYCASEFINIGFTNWHSNPTMWAKCSYNLISTLLFAKILIF